MARLKQYPFQEKRNACARQSKPIERVNEDCLGMKTLSEILRREIVWVNPAHRLSSALLLMRGHNLGGLPVLDGSRLVGMLTYRHVLGQNPNQTVASVMDSEPGAAYSEMTLREAAEIMGRENGEFLPVLDAQNALLGVVSAGDLLAELRRPADPLTGLPWSDTLREWAADKMEKGHEITILFYDVNDFGAFNKIYGHVVGDTVLRNIADVMRGLCDPETENLCRYGGDEFCIATLRRIDEAEDLAERISQECAALRIADVQDQPIRITYGLRGGRRTRERDQIHYAATLNNLINLASRDCMARKAASTSVLSESSNEALAVTAVVQAADRGGAQESQNPVRELRPAPLTPAQIAQKDIKVSGLSARESENQIEIRVELRDPSAARDAAPLSEYSARLPRAAATTEARRRLIAEATLGALRRLLPDTYELRLEDVSLRPTADSRSLVTVVGVLQTPTERRAIVETVFTDADTDLAVAEAALSAALRELRQVAIMQG